jgi:hypothetical protein
MRGDENGSFGSSQQKHSLHSTVLKEVKKLAQEEHSIRPVFQGQFLASTKVGPSRLKASSMSR